MKIQVPISKVDDKNPNSVVYYVGAHSRGDKVEDTPILIDKGKYYQFVYKDSNSNETSWFADSDTINELFPNAPNRDGSLSIPISLESDSEDRGFIGKIILTIIKAFIKPATGLAVKNIASKLEAGHLKERAGLCGIDAKFNLVNFTPQNDEKPYLLFIHGTNSNTLGAFDGLKNTDAFNKMVTDYGNKIIAFNHKTLTVSPLENAAELAKVLPDKAVLHIISHSRGGLVGDILNRYAINNGAVNGFLPEQINYLKKEERADDLKQIDKLNAIFKSKEIAVEKFIRVASPSAGTILASERIDHILNVLFNMLGEKGNIIADLTHELIGSVLEQKSNIDVLPGIEAMNPASPFIKALNAKIDTAAIDGKSLMVISGNGKLSLNFHGLFVILSKLFYLKRNDLVVNTDSMYLGVKRKNEIQYFFDEASYVDHVHYFKNKSTQNALLNAVKTPTGTKIPGFKSVPQLAVPASDRGLDYGELPPQPNIPNGKKPILIMLPGIMGSNIYDGKNKIWLDYLGMIFGELKKMTKPGEAKSVIKTSYYKLYQQLSYTYDVVIFPFDWRLSAEVNARSLNAKIEELMVFDKPIKVIGHSMGGVLFRDFIAYHKETWETLNKKEGFKLVFLGSPLKGSHRILAVLFGKDSVINKLSSLDITHTTKELINIFSQLPGILSLLPFKDSGNEDYASWDVWEKMRNAFGDSKWPIPEIPVLNEFKTYRDKINTVADGLDYTNMIYIAGQDKTTASGYKIENNKLIFEYTKEGDHSVTWESGIPKVLLDKNQVYYTDVTHGDLANAPKLFNGIEEILSKGSTSKISQIRPVFRDANIPFQVPDHFDFDLTEEGLLNTITGTAIVTESVPNRMPLNVTVSHGDLSYASFNIMAGHFKDDAILFAEKAIDGNLGGMLQERIQFGSYPGEIGKNELFTNNNPHFEGALILGLGDPGKLTSFMLSKTVEIGVLDFLLRLKNSKEAPKTIGISSLIIGCGYGGLSISNSTSAIIEGIINANTMSTDLCGNKACTISQVEFIEQDEINAINCLFTCRDLEMNSIVLLQNKSLKTLFGSKKKLRIENKNDWWNRFTIKSTENQNSGGIQKSLIFNATTGDAREEEDELVADAGSISSFIQEISSQNMWSENIARTLFELMIPNNFKDQLKRKGSIAWVLDPDSAGYPWELLQDSSVRSKPLCIDAGMIRQLITKNARTNINRVMNNNVLIIADPNLNDAEHFNQLPGALKEGNTVNELIKGRGYEITFLPQESSHRITTTFFPGSFKIVHIAAHGNYDAQNQERTGIVIGENNFITTAQINQMSNVPELVFVNCCHLGKIVDVDEKLYQKRYKLAANIGTQFINIGVKAVVVAGWQVDDSDAETFAKTFYKNMLNGETFGTSVKKARLDIYRAGSNNTWGAYQCYGDPYYKLDNRFAQTTEKGKEYRIEEEAYIDLENLFKSLDVRGTEINYTLDKLNEIGIARKKAGFESPYITEMEALIYYELGMYIEADTLFENLRKNEDASFSVTALEKYCNNKAYLAFQTFEEEKTKNISKASKDAVILLKSVLKYLNYLCQINSTSERFCLEASTYKRLGYVSLAVQAKIDAYKESVYLYKKAFEKNPIAYSFNNMVIFEAILTLLNNKKINTTKRLGYLRKIESNIKEIKDSNINMDYWEKANYTYSQLAKMLLDFDLCKQSKAWDIVAEAYKETRDKYGSPGKKRAELYNLYLILDALKIKIGTNKHQNILIQEIQKLSDLLK